MNRPDLWSKTGLQTKRDAMRFLYEVFELFDWTDDEIVLDVGCGTGDLTSFILLPFLPLQVKIVGCDISEDMVKYASDKYSDERLAFRQMDIQHPNIWVNWEREQFHKIFSFYVMHWINDKRQAAYNMFSLLKPGGEIFLLFLAHDPLMRAITEVRTRDQRWREYLEPLHVFADNNSEESAKEYQGVLEGVGFKDVAVNLRDVNFHYTGVDNILTIVESMIPKSMPENRKVLFLKAAKTALLERNLIKVGKKGKVYTEYVVVEIYAKKPAEEETSSEEEGKEGAEEEGKDGGSAAKEVGEDGGSKTKEGKPETKEEKNKSKEGTSKPIQGHCIAETKV